MMSETITFEEVASLVRQTVQPIDATGMPYIGLEHIEEGTLRLNGYGQAEDVTSTKSRFSKRDILFGKLRPYFRKVIRAPFDGVCSTDIWVVRAKPGVEQDYLFYWMADQDFVDFATQGSEGTKMPRAKWEHVCRYRQVRLPIDEQRAIASILGALDDKIELNRRMNETLEAMARAVFKSWFVDFEPIPGLGPHREWQNSPLGRIPKGWRVAKLGSEVATVLGGTPSRIKPSYWNGHIPWINSGKANEFRVVEPSEYITQAGLESSATKLLPSRTTVIAITGATLGQVSLTEIDTCANQSIVGVIGSDEFPSEFLYFWVKEHIDDLLAWQTGGAQQHINKNNVNDLPVLCPSDVVIKAYLSVIRPAFDHIKECCFESCTLVAIRDALLPKLISGELRVPEAERIVGRHV